MTLPLSKRLEKMAPSPTVALNTKANRMRADGIDVLNFSVGEPASPTPSQVIETTIESLKRGNTRYGPAGGGLKFRQAICEKLAKENKLRFSEDQIVCGIGAKELLFHIFLALLNEGDEVLLPAPYWVSYGEQILAAGAKPVVIPMPETAGVDLSAARIDTYVTDKTVGIVLCTPSNPAGYVLGADTLKELGNYLKNKNWWVICDEIYEYMTFDKPHHSLLELTPELSDRFILVNGMSKGFAMTGFRVGYCAGPSRVMALVRSLQSHSSTCLPPFIEEAATVAIKAGKSLMSKELQELKTRRDLTLSLAQKIPDVTYIHPEGAFYLFMDLRKVLGRSKRFSPDNSLAFCDYLLESAHVAAVPGEVFGAPGYLRLSYATDEATIRKGMQKLKETLASL